MASDKALEVSTEQRETSNEQLEESLGGQQMVVSVEASSLHESASDQEVSLETLMTVRLALTPLHI
jgi:hypothetical protein